MSLWRRRSRTSDQMSGDQPVVGEPAPGDPHDVEVLEVDLVGSQFTIDAVVARLNDEGVEAVRSSPFYVNVQFGGIARLGEHKLVFKATDKDAVGEALRDAGLL